MPSKTKKQRTWIFTQRSKYKSKDNTPEDMKWIWKSDWEKVEEVRLKRYKSKYIERFSEELRLSDLKKHAGLSDFTNKWRKDRQRLKGQGAKSTKIKSMKVNRKEDYITFVFTAEPTYTTKAKAVNTNNFEINKNVTIYTQQIRILDFFKWADTKPGYVEKEMTVKEIKEILEVANIQVFCNCPSFHWQGHNYNISSMFDASIYPTDIAPKHWNQYHNNDNFICKHLDLTISQALNIYINNMTQMINKYLKK